MKFFMSLFLHCYTLMQMYTLLFKSVYILFFISFVFLIKQNVKLDYFLPFSLKWAHVANMFLVILHPPFA
jgi:hypothetical protein